MTGFGFAIGKGVIEERSFLEFVSVEMSLKGLILRNQLYFRSAIKEAQAYPAWLTLSLRAADIMELC
jgi:hypothetical protein